MATRVSLDISACDDLSRIANCLGQDDSLVNAQSNRP
jgi:hypothetical protein